MMQMSVTQKLIEGLETIVVGPADSSKPATAAAIFCHGFGAPGTDLVGISQELIQLGRGKLNQVVLLFPQAPLSLAEMGMPEGRAWWPLNMQQLMDISEAKNFGDLATSIPEQLPSESERIGRMVDAVRTKYSLPISKIIIGGFSQGAMLTCDAALRLNSRDQTAGLGGLILWSGTLLARDRWNEFGGSVHKLKIVQSHGRQDPILPFAASKNLNEFLTFAGHQTKFIEFDGYHQINLDALAESAALILQAVES